jgi:hypothetical protein
LAFVLQQSWREDDRAQRRNAAPMLESLLAGRDLRLGKSAGTVLTVLIHIVLLWVFATRLGEAPGLVEPQPKPTEVVNLTMLTAPEPAPEPPAAAAAKAAPAQIPPAVPVTVNVSAASQLPPPEWTVSRIASALPAQNGPLSAAPGGGSGAVAGGGVYDPFAGAAPLRKPGSLVRDASINGMVPVGTESSFRLDDAMFAQLRAALAKAHPQVRGTVELNLSVSADGTVLAARPQGGSIAAAIGKDVAGRIVGKRLFLGLTSAIEGLQLVVAI